MTSQMVFDMTRHDNSQPDPQWQAVLARDDSRDGSFVFAVKSTGVYCRPSCPSRRPRRENVLFFSRPDDAERAGFRACMRCRPLDRSAKERRASLISDICAHIDDHLDEAVTLPALASKFGLSSFYLQRVFREAVGVSPREYQQAQRARALKGELQAGTSVTDATYAAGYSSSSRVYENSAAHLGMTPSTYRKGGEGLVVGFITLDSPVGRMLVAATDKGICSIQFGGNDSELIELLRAEFPKADIQRKTVVLQRWVDALLKLIYGEQSKHELPLDIQATAFQMRVWKHLQSIPYGATRSYSDVARSLGAPAATRAVARACATNPVAIAVPCHRVVRSNGSLGGYRWGLKRKEQLLSIESGKASKKRVRRASV
jgi:AraC family transcriptional regulator, regulatory protein of adaptative response / methylated-DNA-[protein]-cysteine methyltransferase